MKVACVLALVGVMVFTGTAFADPVAGAFTSGPDSSFSINFTFLNGASSTADILSIVLDGSTTTAFPVLWDSLGTPGGTAASAFTGSSGENTQVATLFFGGDGFNPGENFTLSGVDPDGDPGPLSVTIGQLAGTTIKFNFAGSTTLSGIFVDDPAQGAGLVWQQRSSVPEPAAMLLLAAAAGFVLRRRRRAA